MGFPPSLFTPSFFFSAVTLLVEFPCNKVLRESIFIRCHLYFAAQVNKKTVWNNFRCTVNQCVDFPNWKDASSALAVSKAVGSENVLVYNKIFQKEKQKKVGPIKYPQTQPIFTLQTPATQDAYHCSNKSLITVRLKHSVLLDIVQLG